MKTKSQSGFSLLEVLIAIAILAVLTTIILTTFTNFRKNQALEKDTELVVQILTEARNQTISSKNASVYGVHFEAQTVTLFSGGTYSPSDPNNKVYLLSPTDTILSITLTGGGNDVVFKRLSGETSQNGTVTVSSPGISRTKTVTIHKTGLSESQ